MHAPSNRNCRRDLSQWQPSHLNWQLDDGVGILTLNRPERKNPLTCDSYAELRELFRDLQYADAVKTVVSSPALVTTLARAATCTRSPARWLT